MKRERERKKERERKTRNKEIMQHGFRKPVQNLHQKALTSWMPISHRLPSFTHTRTHIAWHDHGPFTVVKDMHTTRQNWSFFLFSNGPCICSLGSSSLDDVQKRKDSRAWAVLYVQYSASTHTTVQIFLHIVAFPCVLSSLNIPSTAAAVQRYYMVKKWGTMRSFLFLLLTTLLFSRPVFHGRSQFLFVLLLLWCQVTSPAEYFRVILILHDWSVLLV